LQSRQRAPASNCDPVSGARRHGQPLGADGAGRGAGPGGAGDRHPASPKSASSHHADSRQQSAPRSERRRTPARPTANAPATEPATEIAPPVVADPTLIDRDKFPRTRNRSRRTDFSRTYSPSVTDVASQPRARRSATTGRAGNSFHPGCAIAASTASPLQGNPAEGSPSYMGGIRVNAGVRRHRQTGDLIPTNAIDAPTCWSSKPGVRPQTRSPAAVNIGMKNASPTSGFRGRAAKPAPSAAPAGLRNTALQKGACRPLSRGAGAR